jgi:hypothetical protein
MTTVINRLRFTAACFKQAWFEGLAEATTKAMDLGTTIATTKKGRFSTVGIAGAAIGLRSSSAYAAAGTNCGKQDATSSIVKLFQNIGVLLYVIGGVFSLICFAGAALMFMASGNNPGRADKGMKWAKHTVIGLAFLAGGFFFRSVVVDFVGSSAQVAGGGTPQQGANGLLSDCGVPGAPVG